MGGENVRRRRGHRRMILVNFDYRVRIRLQSGDSFFRIITGVGRGDQLSIGIRQRKNQTNRVILPGTTGTSPARADDARRREGVSIQLVDVNVRIR